MPLPQEIELKLDVPSDCVGRLEHMGLLKGVKPAHARTLSTVYFDTDKHKFHKSGFSLRVRTEAGRYRQTIKQRRNRGAGLFDRYEWESDIAGREPDLDAARDTGLRRLLSKKLRHNLKPIIETRVKRRVFLIHRGGSKIELALDKGNVKAAGKTTPLCEVELELKEGDADELFKLARMLGNAVPVMPATKSKAGRGYDLIANERIGPVHSEAIVLAPSADWATAFRIVARACLHQVAANQTGLIRGDFEALHQMRVGIRQLRAAISLFKDMLPGPQTEAMKSELKWLTSDLGPARELDVFIRTVVKNTKRRQADGTGFDAVAGDLRERRDQALGRAREAVGSLRYRRLLLDAMAWIEIGDWVGNANEIGRALRARSVVEAAAEELRRRVKKIRKQGTKLAKLDATARHKLRIQAKKFRYACEFFAGAFPDKKSAARREKFVATLKSLQNTLGDLNDIRVHQDLTRGVVRRPSAGKRRRRVAKAFAAGRLSGGESARFDLVMRAAKGAYRKLAKAKPFWT